jgi:hypothetical protein
MGVVGDMSKYMQYQTGTAIADAAKNPGGVAGIGAGLGAGMGMAQQMGSAMGGMNAPSQSGPGSPPPLPQNVAASYYVAIDGKQQGPFDLQSLRGKIAGGTVGGQTLVWTAGMPQWVTLETVSELSPLLSQVPPPLPPNS